MTVAEAPPAEPPAPHPAPAPSATDTHPALPPPNTVLPEDTGPTGTGPVRAYEEALPKETVPGGHSEQPT
ncbi:MAG: hypothetical protein VW405_23295, partial [Rhodospirillaceae bacterium]